MHIIFRRGKSILYLLPSLLFLVTGLMLSQVHAGSYTPPDLDGFKLHDERDADGDGNGINETHIKHYLNPAGNSIVSMTTKGRVWAWSLDTRNNDSGVHNYVIRDSDCDGVLDEVYGLDDEFHVPDCLE